MRFCLKNKAQEWQYITVIPAIRRLRQKTTPIEVSLELHSETSASKNKTRAQETQLRY